MLSGYLYLISATGKEVESKMGDEEDRKIGM
jgi:hypothetical protein